MKELKKLKTKRKTIRSRVTACHNRIGSHPSFTILQVDSERANLLDYKEDHRNLDNLI